MAKAVQAVPIAHISKLANLDLTPEQEKMYQGHLASILELMEQISTIDVGTEIATARTSDAENIWREDVVGESFTQDQALANAHRAYEGYFVVDRILKEKDE